MATPAMEERIVGLMPEDAKAVLLAKRPSRSATVPALPRRATCRISRSRTRPRTAGRPGSAPRPQPPGEPSGTGVVPRPDRVPAGQQRRPGGGALRLGRVVGQPVSLLGERVDPPGPRSPQRPAAVAAQLTEAEVVDVEEQDVRLVRHLNLTLQHGGPWRHDR